MGFVRRVITSALDLANLAKHNANFADIETDLNAHDERLDTVETEQAAQSERIDNIVASGGESNIEIVDARQPASGDAYTTLGGRLNAVDTQLAETEQQIIDLETNKAARVYVDNQLSKIGSAKPSGAFPTLTDLQSAYPNGDGVNYYVVTADNNWYYWSGSAWTKGGLFNATVSSDFPATNGVTNGNFLNTTGWSGATDIFTSFLTAANNTLSIKGRDTTNVPMATTTTTIPCVNGRKLYIRLKRKVTNGDCRLTDLQVLGSSGGAIYSVSPISNPVINNQYVNSVIVTLSSSLTGNIQLRVRHSYVDTATAIDKIMELQYVEVIDLTSTFGFGDEPTVEEMDQILSRFPNSWFSGTVSPLLTQKELYTSVATVNTEIIAINESLSTIKKEPFKRLSDMWVRWQIPNNEKAPIGIFGDSTVDWAGSGVTPHEDQDIANGGLGKVDYINTKAYPYKLQQLIREETGSTAGRVYNIGYSGRTMTWGNDNADAIFGGVYSDVEMVGIAFGINDRLAPQTYKDYATSFRSELLECINYLYNKGIQPFLITSQATVESSQESTMTTYPLRSSEAINSVANRVKKEIAKEYNLELIDLSSFDEHLMEYSGYLLGDLINGDRLHFIELGHQKEAEYIYSCLCPRVITKTDNDRTYLSFANQHYKSNIPSDKLSFRTDTPYGGMKVYTAYTKANSNDLLIQDFWVFNRTKKKVNVYAIVNTVTNFSYVNANGVNVTITSTKQLIGTYDIGSIHLKAFTGLTTNVDFVGFQVEVVSE